MANYTTLPCLSSGSKGRKDRGPQGSVKKEEKKVMSVNFFFFCHSLDEGF